jgi:hypothetical protein
MKKVFDTSSWQPRKDASESLKDIFYKRCLHAEMLILSKVKQEKEYNIDNFDSGLGVEDIIRAEISNILPERYHVTKGVINDRNGYTSGNHDIVIFNKLWFPFLKSGATVESRRYHFPIEGVYALGEIKQCLTTETLQNAMKKLIIAKRLERPKTGRNRVIENRELSSCEHGFTNPLFTFLIAAETDENTEIDTIFQTFFDINKQLKRHELVNCLCILQKATIVWSYYDETTNSYSPAYFYDVDRDLSSPLIPMLLSVDQSRKGAFSDLLTILGTHLYNTVLGAEDIAVAYSNDYNSIKIPPIEKYTINPE